MTINRREFLGVAGGAIAGTALFDAALLNALAAAPQQSSLIPIDKGFTPAQLAALRLRGEPRVYRGPQRYAIGMPCGGVAAGQLYVLGDGTLGGWHVDGRRNDTGYGATSYQSHRPPRELLQGFRIVIDDDAGMRRRGFGLADPEFGGAYDAIEFVGEYPSAEVRYASSDSSATPPIDITLRAGSPFIPLNSRDSALPCTLLRFTLHNRGTEPINGGMQGWLQNGVEPVEPGQPSAVRRNRVVREEKLTSVVMDAIPDTSSTDANEPDRLLFDFEGDDFKGWTVEGEAFAAKPAQGTQPNQQRVSGFAGHGLINSYPGSDAPTGKMTSDPFTIDRRYLTMLIGGGGDRRHTCVNLLVDGKAARSVTGKNDERLAPMAWDVSEFRGREARLEIIDAASGAWGHVNVDHIALVDRLPSELQRPRPDSLTNGSMALSFTDHIALAAAGVDDLAKLGFSMNEERSSRTDAPVALIEAPFSLMPGETKELTFIVSWCFPNLHTNQGQMYSNWFSDALDVAKYVATNRDRLVAQTELFRKTFYGDTTLPWWLALRLMMPMANLATGIAQWWKNGRFWAWEGVGSCHGTCTHVWNYAQGEARLFPDMSRSTRVMQDLGSAFEEGTGRVAFRGEVKGGFEYAADGQAGTVLKCLREHRQSADNAFLNANWPRIKLALEYLIARDAERGTPDGIIFGNQHNTYDIDFVGANTFVGSLYLAALHAGAAMADDMQDGPAAKRYRKLAASGRKWTEENLFNGEYFIQKFEGDFAFDPRPSQVDKTPWQYGTGCLADQLFGQTWARSLDLPTIYDPGMVRTALKSIYRYAWTPQVGVYNAEFPPERYFARDREGGLFICTWPRGGRPRQPVRYRDEVWTGCEYQLAAGMMWEGLIDEALVMVKAVDERYDGALHNPWNEVECGDHYSRALASWGVLLALAGFTYDGPHGVMGMSPRLTPEDFAAFFSAAEGWGLLSQRRATNLQTNVVEVRWGRVRLSAFTTTLPDGVDLNNVVCLASGNGGRVNASVVREGERVAATLDAPMTIEAGKSLEVRWNW